MALGGHHGGRVVVEVVTARTVCIAGNYIALKVLMVHVHALVHHGDDDLHADIGILIAGIDIMPLAGEVRVVEGTGMYRELRGNRHNAGHFCERAGGLGHGNLVIELHIVEAVKAGLAGTGLPLPGIREHAAERLDAQVFQQAVQGRHLGGLPLGQRLLHHARGGIVKLHRHPSGNVKKVRIGLCGRGFRRRDRFFRPAGGKRDGQGEQGYQMTSEAFHTFCVFLVSKDSPIFLKM